MTESPEIAEMPPVLTPAEVCRVLRKRVKRPCKTVRALERNGLRVLKVGRELRVLRKDLEAFLASGEARPERRAP